MSSDADIKEKVKERVQRSSRTEAVEPPLFQVLLHNDHYTSMEFVVAVLQSVFRKSTDEAVRIMLAVHQRGLGIAGIYPRDIAETKVRIVGEHARAHGYPLRCTAEPISST